MKALKIYLVGLSLVALAACGTAPLEPAKSLSDRIDYAEAGVAAIQESAANAHHNKTLSDSDTKYVLKVTEQIDAAFEEARSLAVLGQASTAELKFSAVSSMLSDLQKYLQQKGVK